MPLKETLVTDYWSRITISQYVIFGAAYIGRNNKVAMTSGFNCHQIDNVPDFRFQISTEATEDQTVFDGRFDRTQARLF